MSQTLLLLPGDGIGPEVTEQARRVAEVLVPDLTFDEDLVGGASIDAHGEPLTVNALVKAKFIGNRFRHRVIGIAELCNGALTGKE